MKAVVVVSPGEVEIKEIPVPQHSEYQVLVKQLSCSFCNTTDLNIIRGDYSLHGLPNYPLILGHEGVGRVIEKGSKVRNFNISDIVLHTQLDPDDDQLVLPSGEVLFPGWGGLVEYAVATDWRAMHADGIGPQDSRFKPLYYAQLVLRHKMDTVLAPVLITWREVISAIKQFGFSANDSIVIFGDGPVGLSMVLFCKLLGMYPIILCGHHYWRLERAKKLGADVTIDTKAQDPKKLVRDLLPGGCDFVVDAVGNAEIVKCSLRLIKHNGKIFIYGVVKQESILLGLRSGRAPDNFQIRCYQQENMFETGLAHQQIENLLHMGCITPQDFVTHVLPLERIREGIDHLQKREALKVVINFEDRQ